MLKTNAMSQEVIAKKDYNYLQCTCSHTFATIFSLYLLTSPSASLVLSVLLHNFHSIIEFQAM